MVSSASPEAYLREATDALHDAAEGVERAIRAVGEADELGLSGQVETLYDVVLRTLGAVAHRYAELAGRRLERELTDRRAAEGEKSEAGAERILSLRTPKAT